MNHWWESDQLCTYRPYDITVHDVMPTLLRRAIAEGALIQYYTPDIVRKPQKTREENAEYIKNVLQLNLVMIKESSLGNVYFFVSDETLLTLNYQGATVDLNCITTNPSLHQDVVAFWTSAFDTLEDPNYGQIYMLKRDSDGYSIHHLGTPGASLIRQNYTPIVLENYDHVVKDLQSAAPCGRLIIASGEPGCGKTWMIRGLLQEVPGARFIIVPPSLIGRLGEPELLPDLKGHIEAMRTPKDGKKVNAIVFVIEDADMALLPRMGDNMSVMQSMLNTTDGIIGAVLDVRVIATTNAKKVELEPALMRHGRLCRHIEVGKLKMAEATEAFIQIMKDRTGTPVPKFTKEVPLADVYREAFNARS